MDRYEEALERAKKNYRTAQDLCDGSQIGVECFKNTLISIFPELKEPEDERIRKGMLQGFKDYGEPEYVWWEGVKVKECIAWLEKQGEQKELSQSKVTKKSDQDGMSTDIAIKALNHNTVNDSYCKENCKGFQETGKCYADWDCEAKRKAEQNLDWSEEDEEQVSIITNIVQAYCGKLIDCRANLKWLKSLKERISL